MRCSNHYYQMQYWMKQWFYTGMVHISLFKKKHSLLALNELYQYDNAIFTEDTGHCQLPKNKSKVIKDICTQFLTLTCAAALAQQ